MRTRHRALLIFFVSGWLFGLGGFVVGERIARAAWLLAGVVFTLGVVVAVVLSQALETVTWRFSMRRSMLGIALFTVSSPTGVLVMALVTVARNKLFPGTAETHDSLFLALYLGSAANALVIAAGLRTLTGRREGRLPMHMAFAPLWAALLSLCLPGHYGETLGIPLFLVTTNALLTLVAGVWLLRGASMGPVAA